MPILVSDEVLRNNLMRLYEYLKSEFYDVTYASCKIELDIGKIRALYDKHGEELVFPFVAKNNFDEHHTLSNYKNDVSSKEKLFKGARFGCCVVFSSTDFVEVITGHELWVSNQGRATILKFSEIVALYDKDISCSCTYRELCKDKKVLSKALGGLLESDSPDDYFEKIFAGEIKEDPYEE
ncbi:MAG: hypothetical protein LBB91_01100 [Clostridiales bacterium]|jgi:hypothetical protein|nr:hypothetical protein [Clostridiales bacterium]